jgi:uroporphyrinogen decarboxylase
LNREEAELMSMTPRERILAALEHREPDRLPIDFAGTDCSSLHVIAYHRLRRKLGIEPRPIRLACLTQQVVEADREVQDRFGGDARGLYFHPKEWRLWENSGYGAPVEAPANWRPETLADGSAVVRGADGTVLSKRTSGGYYFDPVHFPLAGVTSPAELAAHARVFERWDWPAVMDETVADYAARAKAVYESTDRAVVASWRMHYLQAGQLLRGYEQFMIDLLADEPLARGILDRLHAVYLERARRFLDAAGKWLDIVFFTDDLGTQQGPLISPELYRRLLKPYWAELIGLVRQSGQKVLMHACGAVSEFIPDLAEMGVDALNPVQVTAAGMAPGRLKREFGRDLAFWGGGVSTQGVLDAASPAEVRDEVRRNVDALAPGGGFVFTQVHNIQANVPPENIIAAFDAARDLG